MEVLEACTENCRIRVRELRVRLVKDQKRASHAGCAHEPGHLVGGQGGRGGVMRVAHHHAPRTPHAGLEGIYVRNAVSERDLDYSLARDFQGSRVVSEGRGGG